jgi:acylpyruvate hydrolase
MKLVTFTAYGYTRIGVVKNNEVVDLNYGYQAMLESQGKLRSELIAEAIIPANMVGFLQGGKESLSIANEVVDYVLTNRNSFKCPLVHRYEDVRIEAPLQKPGKIICVGHNYREHIAEMGRDVPPFPVIFAKFGNAVKGPQDDIPHFPVSEMLDYEAEFAIVVGQRARNVSEDEAIDYVAGYTIANDITYRDIQRRTIQWLQGKSVEGSLPLGPWLVTPDELSDPSGAGLGVRLTVNGEERQNTNTSNFVFDIKYLVEFLSNLMTLEPGDLILTGTPGGVGFAMEPKVFLKNGDIVKIEIDQIGTLENKVIKVIS